MDDKQLQELQELRAFVTGVKAEYKSAKKVLDNIEALQVKYGQADEAANRIVEDAAGFKTELQTASAQATASLAEIEKIKNSITTHLDAANTSISELQKISTTAAELKGAVEGQKEAIDSHVALSKNLSEQITEFKNSTEANLLASKELLTDFQTKAESMSSAYQAFLEIKDKIDDKKTGLKAALDLVQKANTDSAALVEQINQFKEEASKANGDIAVLHQESEQVLEQIRVHAKDIEGKKSQVEEVVGITIDGALTNKFETRKKEIEDSLNHPVFSWRTILFFSVLLLVIAVLLPFTSFFKDLFSFGDLTGLDGFFIRLFYTSPLVFLVIFSAVQYSRERLYLEKYAFKAASAAAIRNHTEFLIEKFTAKDVLPFTTEVFSLIYGEPFSDKKKQSSDEKKQKDDSKVENLNLLDNIKDLKELIPDEVLLKQVIEVLTKPVK